MVHGRVFVLAVQLWAVGARPQQVQSLAPATQQPTITQLGGQVTPPNGPATGQVQPQSAAPPLSPLPFASGQRPLINQAALNAASRERRQGLEMIIRTAQNLVGQMLRMVAGTVEARMFQSGFRGPTDFVPPSESGAAQALAGAQQQLALLNQVMPATGAAASAVPAGIPVNTVQLPAGTQPPAQTMPNGLSSAVAGVPLPASSPNAALGTLSAGTNQTAGTPVQTPTLPTTPTNATPAAAARARPALVKRQMPNIPSLVLLDHHHVNSSDPNHVHNSSDPNHVHNSSDPNHVHAAAMRGVVQLTELSQLALQQDNINARQLQQGRNSSTLGKQGRKRNDAYEIDVPASYALVTAVLAALVLL